MFLFSDTQIVKESFLEDVNALLNSGEVPNLFGGDEMEGIMTAMRPICQQLQLPQTKSSMYAQFVRRVRAHLHLVVCMSPVGDTFRARLRMYPSLINCSTIDWFSEWPGEALQSVAAQKFEHTDFSTDEIKHGVVEMCQYIHQSVATMSKRYWDEVQRENHVTPTSYLELLSTYNALIDVRKMEVGKNKNRLVVGLDKVNSTAEQVAGMQEELTELQPVLKKTAIEVEEMMAVISVDKESAEVTKVAVAKEEKEANRMKEETQAIADSAQKDLDEALPALDAAVQALKQLTRDQIVEVKNFQRPPGGVLLTMKAVCIMFGVKPNMVDDPNKFGAKIPDYWEPAKKNLLSDPTKFLNDLVKFDKDSIAEKTINSVKVVTELEEFRPEVMQKASIAATSMCKWVLAMEKYYRVSVSVEPKRKALEQAKTDLEITMAKLAEAQKVLQEVTDRVADLEEKYEERFCVSCHSVGRTCFVENNSVGCDPLFECFY